MSKNIVVCYDGTAQDHGDNSIIHRLYSNCVQDEKQIVMYDTGVGTQIGILRAITGLAFGRGIRLNVKQGLDFINKNYVKGDKVFIFGWSRGAYTALLLCHELMSMPRHNVSIKVPVHFLGAFDTVASLGLFTGAKLSTDIVPTNVEHGYHLLAKNEYRKKFRPTIWRGSGDYRNIRQEWVDGSHANLGGLDFTPEPEFPSLGDNYLNQMEITAAWVGGLRLEDSSRHSGVNDVDTGMETHVNTYKGIWKLWKSEKRDYE